jgi:hypothetical protein
MTRGPVGALAGIIACAAAGFAQNVENSEPPEPWLTAVARAEQILDCMSPDQAAAPDPAGAAISLIEQALRDLGKAPPAGAQEMMTRGAFRAAAVRLLDRTQARRDAWNKAHAEASALLAKNALTRAAERVAAAAPLPCAADFSGLSGRIAEARRRAEAVLLDADAKMLRAQSTFDLKESIRLAKEAVARYGEARELNVDDPRPPARLASAKALLASITSVVKHDILVLSNPGGAKLVLRGGDERECAETPCKFHFDAAYFDKSGGAFWDSKRLTQPVVATITKEGYRPVEATLTDGPLTFKASMPGRKFAQNYYYFSRSRFEIRLEVVPGE